MGPHFPANGFQSSAIHSDVEEITQLGALSLTQSTTDVEGSADIVQRLAGMHQRCRDLLEEVEQFSDYLKQKNRGEAISCSKLKGSITSEMKMFNKLLADPTNPKAIHAARSSNLVYLDALWSTAKCCSCILSFRGVDGSWHTRMKSLSQPALVDIVAQDGLEWVKVSATTEKRIIWDLAKAGLVDSSGDESEDGQAREDEDDNPQGLLRQIPKLVKASRATRVQYRRPVIRLVLPRISSTPESREVAGFLNQIRDLGVVVQTADQIPIPQPLNEVLPIMAAERHQSFTDTLNVDCTMLLAFVSDLSYDNIQPASWQGSHLRQQILIESKDQLLPNSVWPVCGSRKLQATREAAIRMNEIVDIIGTDSEKRRRDLILNVNRLSKEQLLADFQSLSKYTIPVDWSIPIDVVEVDVETMLSKLPLAAAQVAAILTPINQSVFLWGWQSGFTTISSNAVVAKEIQQTIERDRVDDNLRGPDIWLSPTSRSLVGKELTGRNKLPKGFTGLGMARNVNDDEVLRSV